MHRPYNYYFEIPPSVQDYIRIHTRTEDITTIPLNDINEIFSTIPESEYMMLLTVERQAQKYIH